MLSYLQGSTQPKNQWPYTSVHILQYSASFVNGCAIRRITKYLASTYTHVDLTDRNLRLTTRKLVYRNDIEKGIDCYIDAEFEREWARADADNVENVMSCTGYEITYAGCPVL